MRVGPDNRRSGYPGRKGNWKLWDRSENERGSFGIVGRLKDQSESSDSLEDLRIFADGPSGLSNSVLGPRSVALGSRECDLRIMRLAASAGSTDRKQVPGLSPTGRESREG